MSKGNLFEQLHDDFCDPISVWAKKMAQETKEIYDNALLELLKTEIKAGISNGGGV